MTVYEREAEIIDGKYTFIASLIAGGTAGTFVDISLFPLDTLKTRIQSQNGFLKSGGFKNLYKGLYPVLIGSAPTAAVFFVAYDGIKTLLEPKVIQQYHSYVHMTAASLGEMAACLIRVPVEVKKQRKQALIQENGRFAFKLLYRGYWSTVLRDMPFSLLQFPLWEYFKVVLSSYFRRDTYPIEGAICGAIAGGISAAVTTPLDVVKTRIMLSNKLTQSSELQISVILQMLYKESGIRGLFVGLGPRVAWITIGGFIFFGTYEKTKMLISDTLTLISPYSKA